MKERVKYLYQQVVLKDDEIRRLRAEIAVLRQSVSEMSEQIVMMDMRRRISELDRDGPLRRTPGRPNKHSASIP